VSVLIPGDVVDLYYYGESNGIRAVRAKIQELDGTGVTVVNTVAGDLQFYPWRSVQRMILLIAYEPE
jgi:hypothetical protein